MNTHRVVDTIQLTLYLRLVKLGIIDRYQRQLMTLLRIAYDTELTDDLPLIDRIDIIATLGIRSRELETPGLALFVELCWQCRTIRRRSKANTAQVNRLLPFVACCDDILLTRRDELPGSDIVLSKRLVVFVQLDGALVPGLSAAVKGIASLR